MYKIIHIYPSVPVFCKLDRKDLHSDIVLEFFAITFEK